MLMPNDESFKSQSGVHVKAAEWMYASRILECQTAASLFSLSKDFAIS